MVLAALILLPILTLLFLAKPRAWLPMYMFFLPVSPQVAVGDIPVSMTNIIFFAGFFAIVSYRLMNRKWKVPRSLIVSTTALLLLSLSISALYAWLMWGGKIGQISALKVLRISEAFIVLFMSFGFNAAISTLALKRLFHALFFGAAIGAAFGLLSVINIDLFYSLYKAERYYGFKILIPGVELWRAVGVFLDPNHLSSYMSMIILLAIVLWRRREISVSSPFLAIVLVLCSTALLMTFSRAGWLFLLVSMAVYVLVSRDLTGQRKAALLSTMLGSLVLCVIIFGFVLPGLNVGLLNRVLSTVDLASSGEWNAAMSGRLQVWQVGWHVFLTHPIFGIGYKCLPELFLMGDNNYLTMLAEGGIVGAIIWVFWLGVVTSGTYRLARKHWLGEYLFAVWLAMLVNMATADIMTYWRTLPLFFALLGVGLAITYRNVDCPKEPVTSHG